MVCKVSHHFCSALLATRLKSWDERKREGKEKIVTRTFTATNCKAKEHKFFSCYMQLRHNGQLLPGIVAFSKARLLPPLLKRQTSSHQSLAQYSWVPSRKCHHFKPRLKVQLTQKNFVKCHKCKTTVTNITNVITDYGHVTMVTTRVYQIKSRFWFSVHNRKD